MSGVPFEGEFPAEVGVWILMAPSGATFHADSPIATVKVEMNARIPATVMLARMHAAMDEAAAEDRLCDAAPDLLEALASIARGVWNKDACIRIASEAIAKVRLQ